MKSKNNLWVIALLMAPLVHGCAELYTPQNGEDGLGSASVRATVAGLSADEVTAIQITVSGPNIAPDIVSELSKDVGTGDWSGLIANIPAGIDRGFAAEAFDVADVVVYSGSVTGVTIDDGQQVAVNLFMQQSTPPDPFANTVPLFESLVVSSAQVAPGDDVTLTAVVTDPDPGDVLTLSWTATGGTFDLTDAPAVTWTAPSVEGLYSLTIAASDNTGATSALTVSIDVRIDFGSGSASLQADLNTWPEAQNLVPNPTRIDVGETTLLDLLASDPDGDPLTYAWSADCVGTFSDVNAEDPSFTLDVDNAEAPCALTVVLDDGRGGSNSASATIATGPPVGTCGGGVCTAQFACTVPGILEAIAQGGGPHTFACGGPTTLPTTSEIVVDNDVVLDGEGNITLQAAAAHRLLYVPSNVVAELRGFVVSAGTADALTGGGGIFNDGTLTLRDTEVFDNGSASGGGGIYNHINGDLTLISCNIRANNTGDPGGGGIFNAGILSMTGCTVDRNGAGGGWSGGGILNRGTMTVAGSSVVNNNAAGGGGIFNDGSMTVDGSTIRNNSTEGGPGGDGGGVLTLGTATFTATLIENNRAGANGGGIYEFGNTNIADCTITNNVANGFDPNPIPGNPILYGGGGIWGVGTMTNTTVSNNRAPDGCGGGILNPFGFTKPAIITGSTIALNSAAYGGGVCASAAGTLELTNSTVSDNSAASAWAIIANTLILTNSTFVQPDGLELFVDGIMQVQGSIINGACGGTPVVTSLGYNIESPGDRCGLSGTGDQVDVAETGPGGLGLDRLLDNGGPTHTHAIRETSRAFDVIPLASCTATDQRGIARPQGAACDVGAFELVP